MKKKRIFLGFSFLFIGVCIFFVMSCDEDVEYRPGKIPILTTTEVSNITQTTAISGGNISNDKGSAVTARGVCWGIDKNPTINTLNSNKTDDGIDTGSFTSNISGLEPNTTYYVRAYATNSAGTGYGNTVSFKTLEDNNINSFTDLRDGNVYKIVSIGNQVWMAENLRYLPSVVGPETGSETAPYYYVYDYNGTNITDAKTSSNYSTYGVLYNWQASKTACPEGWHLPTDAEWTELIEFLGGEEVAGGKLKETGTTHWISPNTDASNETGFTALPAGYRDNNGNFIHFGYNSYWWSATEIYGDYAWYTYLHYNYSIASRHTRSQEMGYSIRCIKD
ncbi:MAG: FISUMP domain-containing protein [Bacteroidales bacterium]|jgi:uncharacterized protein (TIGR02145 family)|nr:FISUMP domain-containing protein [Bacteroidales bacterium]OQA92629.1 MAG: hypothetical protein BWY27_00240 [Bacteroidetes bacterium ADurb.Bin234]MDD2687356.1 FISUMP domain-containing protein [Bacteroidales bacterium]MDD3331235.1 FISUMP domain-containing protein [Bacteroidales bacterium]MDD4044511.1 FISUMP domain-containing protein [Bacteroidales bacterium]